MAFWLRYGRGECHIAQCRNTQAGIEVACARVMVGLFAVQHAGSALNQIALQGDRRFVPLMKPFSEGFFLWLFLSFHAQVQFRWLSTPASDSSLEVVSCVFVLG